MSNSNLSRAERRALVQQAAFSTGPFSSFRSICQNHYMMNAYEMSVIVKELGDLTVADSYGNVIV